MDDDGTKFADELCNVPAVQPGVYELGAYGDQLVSVMHGQCGVTPRLAYDTAGAQTVPTDQILHRAATEWRSNGPLYLLCGCREPIQVIWRYYQQRWSDTGALLPRVPLARIATVCAKV